MSNPWFETFLSRVARPSYFRETSQRELNEDFNKARLEEEYVIIGEKIQYLENRRKDISIMEIIESTAKDKPSMIHRFKINLPTIMNRGSSTKRQTSSKTSEGKRGIELNAKGLMLENERQMQACRKLRSKIKTGLAIQRRLFSAVYRTPPEVWGRIFVFCLPENEDYLEPDQNEAPLLVSRICHMWRTTAIYTPELWNSIAIRLRSQTTMVEFLQNWLRRSGVLPLSLHIVWGPTRSLQVHDPVFDYLLSLACRWRSIRLSSVRGLAWQSFGFPTRAHKLLSYPMPELETLEIEPHISLQTANLERNAPSLKRLWLINRALNPMQVVNSAWHGLSSLRAKYPLDMPSVMRIFKYCPNLTECEIALVDYYQGVVPGSGTIIMPVLESLTIYETSKNILDVFLRILEMPSLKEMSLSTGNIDDIAPWNAKELLLLVKRSGESSRPGLTTLRMKGLNCEENAIRELVFGIPSLFWFDMQFREKELLGHSWVRMLRYGLNTNST